ncbi:MAG: hypothetical protein ABSG85_21015 [Spirochaetia bacterium]|jgi:NAD-dependent SIR2 family protein deacetylase
MGSQGIPHIAEAASLIRSAKYLTAFTGAGISVESGIPPFRGPGGLGAGRVAARAGRWRHGLE